jgi:hypothetical protein
VLDTSVSVSTLLGLTGHDESVTGNVPGLFILSSASRRRLSSAGTGANMCEEPKSCTKLSISESNEFDWDAADRREMTELPSEEPVRGRVATADLLDEDLREGSLQM